MANFIAGETNKTIADRLMSLDISKCGKVRKLYLIFTNKSLVRLTTILGQLLHYQSYCCPSIYLVASVCKLEQSNLFCHLDEVNYLWSNFLTVSPGIAAVIA